MAKLSLTQYINPEVFNRHRDKVEQFVADMTDEELNQAWQMVGDIGVIISTEARKRGGGTAGQPRQGPLS